MKLVTLGFLLIFGLNIAAAKDVVCYIPSWGPDLTSKINPSLCSIFVIAFGTLDGNGNVGLPDNFASFKKLRTANTKLVLAIGGATAGTAVFKQIAATAANRARFAKNALNLVVNNGLDGIDIDWEFPDTGDRAIFVALHSDLKASLGSKYLVSTAVSVGQWLVSTNNVYDIAELGKAVDHINLMSYDMHMDESWDSSFGVSFNAPINAASGDSVDKGINLFLQGGAPASKLMVGVPFYGRQYQLADPSQTSPGSQFIGGHQASDVSYTPAYNSYCSKLSNSVWTKQRDPTAKAPYMYSGNMWISYEDQQSITDKANLAHKYNLGGVMTWALNQDDYDGVCSACKWPLLNALSVAVDRISSSSACKVDGANSSGTSKPAVVATTSPSGGTTKPASTSSSGGTTKPASTSPPNNSGSSNTLTNCVTVGLGAHPSDCSKYLSCSSVGTKPFVMSCSSGLKWNNQAKVCDWNCVA